MSKFYSVAFLLCSLFSLVVGDFLYRTTWNMDNSEVKKRYDAGHHTFIGFGVEGTKNLIVWDSISPTQSFNVNWNEVYGVYSTFDETIAEVLLTTHSGLQASIGKLYTWTGDYSGGGYFTETGSCADPYSSYIGIKVNLNGDIAGRTFGISKYDKKSKNFKPISADILFDGGSIYLKPLEQVFAAYGLNYQTGQVIAAPSIPVMLNVDSGDNTFVFNKGAWGIPDKKN